jgi:predicted GNAT family acetyltransferase
VLEYVERGDQELDYRHTFTPPALRGRGIAKDLVLYALDYARSNGIKVVPTCPYVAKVILENPGYEALAAQPD